MFTRTINRHIAATVFFDARESSRRDTDRQSEQAYQAGTIKKEIAALDDKIAKLTAVTKPSQEQVTELVTLKKNKETLQTQFETIKFSTREDLKGLRGDVVVTRLLKLEANFFKGEITTVDNMAELIAATQKGLDANTPPKTIDDWKKLGYTGEWSFDQAELDVANAFFDKIKNSDSKTKALVAELSRETSSLGSKYLKDTLIGARTTQDESNNLSFQAKRFVDYVNQVGSTNPKVTEFAKLFKTERNTNGEVTHRAIDLGDTNIPSLLRSLVNGHNYVADGAYGSSEKSAVKAVTEFYNKNKTDIAPVFEQMLAYYDANMTSDHAFRGISRRESLESSGVRTFLADLNQDGKIGNDTTNKDQRGDTAWVKESTLAKALDGLTSDEQLVKGINNILSLVGGNTSYKDLDTLLKGLKSDASLYPKFVQGVNIALRNGSLNQMLRNGSLTLVDDKTSKFIDFLETTEGTSAVKKSIKTKLDASAKSVDANPKLSSDEKKAALKAIEDSQSRINDPVFLEQVSRDFSVAITNHRLGLGASSTHSLESFLADNMTVGVFVGKEFNGPSVAGVGISFDKNLISGKGYDVNLVYGAGWAGIAGVTPFVGLAGRVNDWKLAAIGSGVGGDLYVGKMLGNLDATISHAREVSGTTGLGKMMDSFSKDFLKKSKDFTLSPSDIDKVAYDKLSPEQKSQNDTLAKTFSTGTQSRLSRAGFDTEQNALKRYLMLQTALTDTVQQYIDTINIDAVKGGWSAKEFGVHMGVMASIPYILPGISFGKKDVMFEEKTVKREVIEKVESQDIATELAKLGYSLGKPSIAADKASYSISLEKVNGFDPTKLGKIETKLAFDTKTLSLSGLTKGLNISIKNGIILISENDKKVDLAPTNIDTSIDALEPPKEFKALLQERKTRVQLASLTTDRSKNGGYDTVNKFIQTLDKTTDWTNVSTRATLLASLNTFLDVGIHTHYNSLKEVKKQLNTKDISPVTFRAMIMEVRATMMTDSSQSMGLNAQKGEKSNMSMQDHWNNMLTKPSPLSKKLLTSILPTGLATTDFDGLVTGKDKEFTYNEGTINPKMFGLVGAWKFADAGLKFMPPGTVRIATDATGKSYEKPLTDEVKRAIVYDQMMQNPEFKSTIDKIKGKTGLDDASLKSLVATGKTEKDGVKYTMDTTFKTFAYGKCANPSYGLELGAVIRNGKNIGEPNVTGEILRVSEDFATRARFIDTNVSLLTGLEGQKPTIETPTQTQYKTEIETRNVQVGPTNITGVGANAVVNIPGGGTVPVNQLTVAQRVALNSGTLTLKTQVSITTPIITPGTTLTPDTPRATMALGMITTMYYADENGTQVAQEISVDYPDFNVSKFKSAEEYKKFLRDNKFVPAK